MTDSDTRVGARDDATGSRAGDDRHRNRSRVRKALLGLAMCFVLLVAVVAGAGLYLQHRLVGQIDRIPDAFAGLDDRPESSGDALNILLIGSDRRSEDQTTGSSAHAASWVPGAQRSDALMVIHVDADRDGVSVVSIPRDAYVPIPGHGRDKINAAFSYGGPSLAVDTVEGVTDLRIDHVAMVDWEGFERLTDALGGVTVDVSETARDTKNDRTWPKGSHQLDGADALLYVRQRYGLPEGDFDRIKRQQAFMRSLLSQTLSGDTLRSPTTLYDVLDSVTANLSVDDDWGAGDMRGLVWSLRGLRADETDFLTVPLEGTGMVDGASVVFLDADAGAGLWSTMRDDDVGAWVADNPDTELPGTVR